LALAAIIHVLHMTWMTRNGIKLNNAKISLHPAKMKIFTALALRGQLTKGHSLSAEDPISHRLKLPAHHRCDPQTVTVLWKTPQFNWVKVNTDGSVVGTPPLSTCGGLFRDFIGNYRGGFL
jgi:hypothetical protein